MQRPIRPTLTSRQVRSLHSDPTVRRALLATHRAREPLPKGVTVSSTVTDTRTGRELHAITIERSFLFWTRRKTVIVDKEGNVIGSK
jgi:hypothetical protein